MDDETVEEMCLRRSEEQIEKLKEQARIDRLANLHLASRIAHALQILKSVGKVRGVSLCWCANPLEFCCGEFQCIEARKLVSEIHQKPDGTD